MADDVTSGWGRYVITSAVSVVVTAFVFVLVFIACIVTSSGRKCLTKMISRKTMEMPRPQELRTPKPPPPTTLSKPKDNPAVWDVSQLNKDVNNLGQLQPKMRREFYEMPHFMDRSGFYKTAKRDSQYGASAFIDVPDQRYAVPQYIRQAYFVGQRY